MGDLAWKEISCVLAVKVNNLGKAFPEVECRGKDRYRAAKLTRRIRKVSKLLVQIIQSPLKFMKGFSSDDLKMFVDFFIIFEVGIVISASFFLL